MKTNKWKMTLLIWAAMFPFSTVVSYGLTQLPWTAGWPLIARTGCLTSLMVPYMVFGALPLLTTYFKTWLQPTPPARSADAQPPGQPTFVRADNSALPQGGSYPSLQQNGVST